MDNKEKLASILFDLPSNQISNNLIKWALSYLPDNTSSKGENKTSVAPEGPTLQFINDQKLNLHGGFGLAYENLMSLKDKVTSLLPEDGDPTQMKVTINGKEEKGVARVIMMQKLLPQLCESERVFMMALGLQPLGEYIMREQSRKEMGLDELDGPISGKKGLEKFINALTKLKDSIPDEDENSDESEE